MAINADKDSNLHIENAKKSNSVNFSDMNVTQIQHVMEMVQHLKQATQNFKKKLDNLQQKVTNNDSPTI